jgi:hypothetical protein
MARHEIPSIPSMNDLFDTKYDEFARELEGACPELTQQIRSALGLPKERRRDLFKEQVLPFCSPNRDNTKRPEMVLPGTPMPEEVWNAVSSKTKTAIHEYLTFLSFSFLLETGTQADVSGTAFSGDWAKKMMEEMKEKMSGMDFAGISEKIGKLFGSGAAGGMPQIPEKFLKGQIARLAEEIVKEFKIEDFGLDPSVVEAASKDPTKALNMISEVFMKNPNAFQGIIGKLTKKIQQKIQSGSLRPQELVAEAEELMKSFSDNPQFVELMESFRQTFGAASASMGGGGGGSQQSGRMSLIKERLKKKLEAKKAEAAKKAGAPKK